MRQSTSASYDRTTILLHWSTAVLVAGLWIVGQTTDYLPKGPFKTVVWSSHVTFGFVLAVVVAVRILWRSTSGRGLPPSDSGARHVLAKATHYALYALLIAVIGLGIGNAFIRHYNMFDLFHLPQIGDPGLKKQVTHWHELAANAVLIVAGFHAAAALFHHYVLKDHLLFRMRIR